MNKWPLLSIIVPVYGTEKFLRKCLDSLLAETYPNKEIIIVDDASPDNAYEIIKEYTENYDFIKCVRNPENQGLFKARLRGYEAATGEYICSVDSDDFVGVDYHRMLVKKALETEADIVVSKFVIYDAATNKYSYRTYGNYAIENIDLQGDDILKDFFDTEGETSHRWLVWNKVYKKSVWDLAYPDLKKLNQHLIMLEDYVYGVLFMYYSHKYVSSDDDSYFYVKHPAASTGISGGYKKLLKNISDQLTAFSFVENFFKQKNLHNAILKGHLLLKTKQARVWKQTAKSYDLSPEEIQHINKLLSEFCDDAIEYTDVRLDTFFYKQHTPWDCRLEETKKRIMDPHITYVSFDMFDTLVLRPFLVPSDLFICLNTEFDKAVSRLSLQDFHTIRINAERQARAFYRTTKNYEDITLAEIYDVLCDNYHLPLKISNMLMCKEKDLEINFCTARKKIQELYEFALFCGKKVICVTDIYLDRSTVEAILKKCGYTKFDRIFISSEERLSKSTGHLYEHVLNTLNISSDTLIHIGDNWNSDVEKAKAYGICSIYVPKASDLFKNTIPDSKGKKIRANFFNTIHRNPTGNYSKYIYTPDYFGIRCMMGLVADRIFDNPYLSYEPQTDFNRNPYYIGYFALGMHVFGIVQWLIKLCNERKYETIHFVARDGYAAKLVYEIMQQYIPNLPKANYFYMSRKSFLPLTIATADDLYYLPKFAPYKGKTPQDIIDLLHPILILDHFENIKKVFIEHGIFLHKIIENDTEYRQFINVLIPICYSQEKNNGYRSKLKQHFSQIIGKNDVMFDIGYSGRAQAILSNLLGYGVNAAYVHFLDDQVLNYSRRFHFHVDCYYDHVPSIIGKIREVLQSDIIGSCIGYNLTEDSIIPLFEKPSYTYHARFVMQRIHKGMTDFVNDFMSCFSEYKDIMFYRDFDLGFAHENYLQHPSGKDMEMFGTFYFEDEVLHNKQYTSQRLSDLWWKDLQWNRLLTSHTSTALYNIFEYPRWKRIIYYALFERKVLKDKVILRCHNHKYFYLFLRTTYRCMRNIYYWSKAVLKRSPNAISNNKLSNIGIDKKLDGIGKILYYAPSEYGILCALLHKITFNKDKSCFLLISEWRKDRYIPLINSGIFDDVEIYNDFALRKFAYSLDSKLKGATEKNYEAYSEIFLEEFYRLLPYELSTFDKIILQNNTMPIGSYLEKNNLYYEAIEEAAGIYSNNSLLLNNIENTFPLVEKWLLHKYRILQDSPHCKQWYINYDTQFKGFNKEKTVSFSVPEILEQLDKNDRDTILEIFYITGLKKALTNKGLLLLTYPLIARLKISEYEQKTIYAFLADVFSDGRIVYLKPHPDDHVNYDDVLSIQSIRPTVLSELVTYETGATFEAAISTISTSLNNLKHIPTRIFFGESIIQEYRNLIKYYIIAQYIKQTCNQNAKLFVQNISAEIIENILKFSDARYLSDAKVYPLDAFKKTSATQKILILGLATNEELFSKMHNLLSPNDIIISLNPFDYNATIKISKERLSGGYWGDLQDEMLYVTTDSPDCLKFYIKKEMHTLNITLNSILVQVEKNN